MVKNDCHKFPELKVAHSKQFTIMSDKDKQHISHILEAGAGKLLALSVYLSVIKIINFRFISRLTNCFSSRPLFNLEFMI